jgi:hypothetical protein
MPVTKQLVTLVFQDPAGNPIANGSVRIRLQVDVSTATSGGPQVSAGRMLEASLDASGSVTISLWPNSTTVPANSVYFLTAYTALGQPVWKGELTV